MSQAEEALLEQEIAGETNVVGPSEHDGWEDIKDDQPADDSDRDSSTAAHMLEDDILGETDTKPLVSPPSEANDPAMAEDARETSILIESMSGDEANETSAPPPQKPPGTSAGSRRRVEEVVLSAPALATMQKHPSAFLPEDLPAKPQHGHNKRHSKGKGTHIGAQEDLI